MAVESALEGIESDENVLQKHVAFFDRNNDGVIYPWETFQGFRAIGSGILLSSVAALFINMGLSGKTRPGKKFPNLLFPIEIQNISMAKHGSDSGVYDTQGRFVSSKFEEIFAKYTRTNSDGLTADELKEFIKGNREPKDYGGWIGGFSEWKILYYLCKDEKGLLKKDVVRGVYDGSLFQKMAEEKEKAKAVKKKKHMVSSNWDWCYALLSGCSLNQYGSQWQNSFVPSKFEEIFAKYARTNPDGLTADEVNELIKRDREPNDAEGWASALAEWRILYSLGKDENGLLKKDVQGKLPNPLFPTEIKNINMAIHGSDSGVYNNQGRFVPSKFEEIFVKYARTNPDGLTADEVNEFIKANREPKDPEGCCRMEDLDENGLLKKDVVRGAYDGSLFPKLAEQKAKAKKKHM
ncbi:hypothetical protein LXL04_011384 [Taraxacum kok-saghyz]